MNRVQKNVSLNLASINLGKLSGKEGEGDVRAKLGNTQSRLSASERAEEVAATLHGKDKDAKREEEVAALISFAKTGRARLHDSLISFSHEASDGFSAADQALFINPLGAVDHLQSVTLLHGRLSPTLHHSLSPSLAPSNASAAAAANADKLGMLPPPISREASQSSVAVFDSASSPESSPTAKIQQRQRHQQQHQQQQQRNVTFAESTDDDSALPRSAGSGTSQQLPNDSNQAAAQHVNTSRGRLLKECSGLRNQVPSICNHR
jgi:hypothetical protein